MILAELFQKRTARLSELDEPVEIIEPLECLEASRSLGKQTIVLTEQGEMLVEFIRRHLLLK